MVNQCIWYCYLPVYAALDDFLKARGPDIVVAESMRDQGQALMDAVGRLHMNRQADDDGYSRTANIEHAVAQLLPPGASVSPAFSEAALPPPRG